MKIQYKNITPPNSQYSIQNRISQFLNEAVNSIGIYDPYMDTSIINELVSVRAKNIQLLTTHPKDQFLQRLQAFKKQYPDINIECKIDHNCHDRYYIIDNEKVLHYGASHNNAGEKASNLSEMTNQEDIRQFLSNFESWWENATTLDNAK